ncbi:MAG: DUF3467 domain-containing protein [Methanomicrobium sp.]|nr:DUF3467 domain-containing protein [Methanomicrobium sp.]
MEKRDIAVNLPNDLDPVYANRIQVAYKDDEFTFVFLHEIPGTNHARAKAIVSISPKHAKNLSEVLAGSLRDYESKFGEIRNAVEQKTANDTANDGSGDPSDTVTIRGYS